jgi:hypothetical protein
MTTKECLPSSRKNLEPGRVECKGTWQWSLKVVMIIVHGHCELGKNNII